MGRARRDSDDRIVYADPLSEKYSAGLAIVAVVQRRVLVPLEGGIATRKNRRAGMGTRKRALVRRGARSGRGRHDRAHRSRGRDRERPGGRGCPVLPRRKSPKSIRTEHAAAA